MSQRVFHLVPAHLPTVLLVSQHVSATNSFNVTSNPIFFMRLIAGPPQVGRPSKPPSPASQGSKKSDSLYIIIIKVHVILCM